MTTKTIDEKYDDISKAQLEKSLGRNAKISELKNADTDSNLVTECLWQLIKEQESRIKILESKI